jgi:hypothetical protein
MEERRAKIAKDKRISSIGKARSVRRHEGQINRVVKELKQESKQRCQMLHEIKDKEVRDNQRYVEKLHKDPQSPLKLLE